MRQRNGTQSRGFTLVELMVSAAIGVVLVGAAVTFLEEGIGISYRVAQRAEMQQNARIAINLMSQDLSIAGTGIPQGGIQLPSGGGSQNSRFACDASSCYLTANTYTDGRLYSVTPGDGRGPIINGVATDIVTLVHIDDSGLDLGQYPLVGATPSGNQIEVDPRTSPPINDPAVGVRDGDILMMTWRRYPTHLGIAARGPHGWDIIHSHADCKFVSEHRLDEQWQARVQGVYRFRDLM